MNIILIRISNSYWNVNTDQSIFIFQVRRLGLGGGPRPTFDLADPYCYNVSYDYVPEHDPHLAHHFAQKPARKRMKILGFCTKDGRAVCSLKEFNQYRKYLYNQFMDRIHMEMKKLVGKINSLRKDVFLLVYIYICVLIIYIKFYTSIHLGLTKLIKFTYKLVWH